VVVAGGSTGKRAVGGMGRFIQRAGPLGSSCAPNGRRGSNTRGRRVGPHTQSGPTPGTGRSEEASRRRRRRRRNATKPAASAGGARVEVTATGGHSVILTFSPSSDRGGWLTSTATIIIGFLRASPRVCQNLLSKSCVLPTSKKLCKAKKKNSSPTVWHNSLAKSRSNLHQES
jgi:hypothetical protein